MTGEAAETPAGLSDVGAPMATATSVITSRLAFESVAVILAASWTSTHSPAESSDAGESMTTAAATHRKDFDQLNPISVMPQCSVLFSVKP